MRVFISHATEDADLARRLARDLEREGFGVWIAPDSIRHGEEWVDAISQALRECEVLVLLLTPAAVRSYWVKKEVKLAMLLEPEGQMRILPLEVKPVSETDIPSFWRTYQRLPFTEYERGFSLLQQALLSESVAVVESSDLQVATVTAFSAGNAVFDLEFSPDGTSIVAATRSGVLWRWMLPNDRAGVPISAHEKAMRAVAFSPDGGLLATASADTTILLWKMPGGTPARVLEGHTDTVWSVSFSPDGRHMVSGSKDATLRLWTVPEGRCLRVMQGHEKSVYGVAFSPDGDWIASASSDRTVRLWLASGGEAVLLGETTGTLLCANFSPDGTMVATGQWGGSVRLWDTVKQESLRLLEGHTNRVYRVAFSPDGRFLATASADGTVRLWHLPEGRTAHAPLRAHTGWVRGLAFSPDGHLLASGDTDGTVRLWSIQQESQ